MKSFSRLPCNKYLPSSRQSALLRNRPRTASWGGVSSKSSDDIIRGHTRTSTALLCGMLNEMLSLRGARNAVHQFRMSNLIKTTWNEMTEMKRKKYFGTFGNRDQTGPEKTCMCFMCGCQTVTGIIQSRESWGKGFRFLIRDISCCLIAITLNLVSRLVKFC